MGCGICNHLEEWAVVEEDVAQLFRDGERHMAMADAKKALGHTLCGLLGLKHTARRAQTALAGEEADMGLVALFALKADEAEGRGAAHEHLGDMLADRRGNVVRDAREDPLATLGPVIPEHLLEHSHGRWVRRQE